MFDDAGIWSSALWVSAVVLLAYTAILWLAAVIWVAGDIQRRTDSAVLQIGAIAFAAVFFLPGLILYVALRPSETMEERTERRMEMQALAAHAGASPTCGNCYRTVREDYVRCPYCGSQLGVSCPVCEHTNAASWVACPYCGGEQVAVQVAARTRAGGGSYDKPTETTPMVRPSRKPVGPTSRNGHAPAIR